MATTSPAQTLPYIPPVAKPESKRKGTVRSAITYVFLTVLAVFWLIPIFAALLTAVRTMDDITLNGFWSIPSTISLDNFVEAWTSARVSQYLVSSFIVTIPSLIGMLFLSSLTAYALARFKFALNLPIYFMFVAGTMLPFQILLLPVFLLVKNLGIYNTYIALIAIHTTFQMGFCVFVLRNFMRTVPSEIFEAARVDGCNEFKIYWRIMLPLSLPAMASLATLQFTWVFNDYIWALILVNKQDLLPVTAGLATLRGQYTTDWPVITAGALLSTVPTLFVFTFLQRYFIQGLTLGSGK
ncbi:MAG: carbohydrate ABC transporter permease [Anaerolineae bacterium]|jgi:multiple sugar transport system permease protein|nr:carbohydrate ABC transporter permease [Anaerolineae bacterium]